MNILQPLKIEKGPNAGKWHMTDSNSAGVFAAGHCANGCPGHDTAEEAQAHYDLWCAENASFHSDPPGVCEVPGCENPHTMIGTWPGIGPIFWLCTEHATKEGLLEVLRARRNS